MAGYKHLASGTGDAQAAPGPCRLAGYSVFESAGTPAAASVVLRDGTSASGTPVVVIELASNAADSQMLPDILCPSGIFVDRTAGETTITVYIN